MNETVLVSLIVSVIAPLVLGFVTNWSRRQEKKLDWSRQDQVAAKAEKAAKDLIESNEKVAKLAKQTSDKIIGKVDIIHTLVNSNVTKEMEARLEGSRRELVGLKEIMELRRGNGLPPTKEAEAIILATEEGIHELENDLADRRRQQKVVEQQQQQQQQ